MKSTKAEKENRLTKINELLLNGYSRVDIVQYSAENWNINERQTDKYIREVKENITTHFNQTREENIGIALARRENLYKDAREKNEIRTALEVDKDLRKLQGLYEDRLSVSADITNIDLSKGD